MYSILHSQCSIPTKLSSVVAQDRIPALKSAKFAQIPSWVSLKKRIPYPENFQDGQVENVHLISLARDGKLKEVREFLEALNGAGVSVTAKTFKCLFEVCGNLRALPDGRFVHHLLQRTVSNPPGFLQNCALKMYCDCGSFSDARKVFDEMLERDLVSWVIMISAYAQHGLLNEALQLFLSIQASGFRPNQSIFTSLLRSFDDPSFLDLGKQMHSHLVRHGLSTNASIETAVLNMYVKCGWLEGAALVFDKMTAKNKVAWTGLMVGYSSKSDKLQVALALFEKMVWEGVELDEFVFSIVLKVCAALEDLSLGMQIHGWSAKLGLDSAVSVGTPLVDFYVKCASFESAFKTFGRIQEPNDVSWSTIITAYCQIGKFDDALQTFKTLRSQGVVLNSYIYTSIFQACSAHTCFDIGTQVHADAIKGGMISYLYGESAMVTMYSKCGRLDYAFQAFKSLDKPDTTAWTAIICGYAYHGYASEALRLFTEMQVSGVRPNAVTFIAVLTACSHSGSVREGKKILDSMSTIYGVEPTIDHYDCMVDIYSRAGLLDDALELIKSMPVNADAMSWKSLLGGCWIHKNLEIGKTAAENLLLLDPEDTASYVTMFNLYAAFGKWQEAARVRKMMADKNLKKELSCSWITVKGSTHRFIVGDRHHPQTEQIYSKLEELNFEGKIAETALLTEEDLACAFPNRKEQLLVHSERLAIAYGLISLPIKAPILVFKNLRACKDCHEFAKKVSLETGRDVIVRDSNRFHHFKRGNCSCNDYW